VVTVRTGAAQLEWLDARIGRSPKGPVHHVDELLPSGYDRHLRLFHPFVPWDSKPEVPVPQGLRRSWESLATEVGVAFHGELQWRSLESALPIQPGGGRRYCVFGGQIERSTASTMMALLTARSPKVHVHYVYSHPACITEEYGFAPVAYVGDAGDFDAVTEEARMPGPTYIWPEDRLWVVATDYDLTSTYIACDASTYEALSAEPGLETIAVSRRSRIDYGADQLNGTGYPEDHKPAKRRWWR